LRFRHLQRHPRLPTGVSAYPLEIQVNAIINYAIDLQLDQPPNETSTYTVDGGIYIWDTDGDGIASFNAAPGQWTVTGSTAGAEGTLYASGEFTFAPAYYFNPQELLVDPWAGFAGCSGYCQGSGEILSDTSGSLNGDFTYQAVPEPTSAALLGVGLFGALIGRRGEAAGSRASQSGARWPSS
jgi:hypothetical protein